MDKLDLLKINKLLKELDYIESEFEYRSEIIKDADSEFINCIISFLEQHPDLKEVYDKKITNKINESVKNQEKNLDIEEIKNIDTDSDLSDDSPPDIDYKKKSSQIKKLYREIVKLTHPDKVKRKKLNDLYIKSTEYYNSDNKIGIYQLCYELGIEFEIEIDDDKIIETYINSLRDRIKFLESTFTWKWFNSESEQDKNQVMVDYIKMRITT